MVVGLFLFWSLHWSISAEYEQDCANAGFPIGGTGTGAPSVASNDGSDSTLQGQNIGSKIYLPVKLITLSLICAGIILL